MKELKIIKAAKAAKAAGYTHMTSVVRSKFNTVYHNVNEIDSVIENGWMAAPRHYQGWRMGVTSNNVPDHSINKSKAIRMFCK